MKKYNRLLILCLLLVALPVFAAVPSAINFQGKLTDSNAAPIDGSADFNFAVYDAETDGNILWEEDHIDVVVAGGIFNVFLGKGTGGGSLSSVFTGNDLWVEVMVNGEILTPRQSVGSVAYSFHSNTATSAEDVPNKDINPNSITIDGTMVINSSGQWVGDSTGLVGAQGEKGDTGDIGLTGPQGDQGIQGLVGPQGTQGLTGDTGLTGAAGPQGDIGLTGADGPQGITGLVGPQGLKGDKGDKGDPGQDTAIEAGAGIIISENTASVDTNTIATKEYVDNSIGSGGGLNINSVLHLEPQSSPPENPISGDIYFSTTEELLIFANGKWNPILAAAAEHGSETLTSGSGTWTVPAGIYSIKVTLIGGGGGAQPAINFENSMVVTVGVGGNGGVQTDQYIDVVPGEEIPYSIGAGGLGGAFMALGMNNPTRVSSAGGNTYFGNISATGGQGAALNISCCPVLYFGTNGVSGSPIGTYLYGSSGLGGSGYGVADLLGHIGGTGIPGAIHIEY